VNAWTLVNHRRSGGYDDTYAAGWLPVVSDIRATDQGLYRTRPDTNQVDKSSKMHQKVVL